MSERLLFIQACVNRSEEIASVCDRFGISEKTGHKWLRRFREGGPPALEDRSHARHDQPHRMSAEVAQRIVALRRRFPQYGPEKLRDRLMQKEPAVRWPAASTIGELLVREKLVRRRRRRDRSAERRVLDGSRTAASAPNVVWTADFKGEFRLGSGAYCYPLTVMDLQTRYLLGCCALDSTAIAKAKPVFVRLFKEYGLPEVLRTDNGVPFAQPNALGRLGSLALWWVRLDIRPEHITPARPAENGAHERFHKTLKAAATKPPSSSLSAQQRRFDRFRVEYNDERPHESLPERRPPGTSYCSSPRAYPTKLPDPTYPDSANVRLVNSNGFIKYRDRPIFLSTNLARQYVALSPAEGDLVTIAYAKLALGEYDLQLNRFSPRVRWLG